MDTDHREMTRIAEMIHRQLRTHAAARLGQVVAAVQNLLGNLAQLGHLSRLLTICADREWNTAAGNVCDRIRQKLSELSYYSSHVEQTLQGGGRRGFSARDIMADLRQVEEEFDGFRYDRGQKALSVIVGPVQLEDVYLGEFEIRLLLASMGQAGRSSASYRVVAMDPNPAGCNEAVSHPHLSDERLCEGEASAPIRAALAEGRICDFFQVVNAVLTTYNAASPYVSLRDWNGRPCHDCGETMSESNSSTCTSCDNDVCDGCISFCRNCDESTCQECLECCSACGEKMCPSCKVECPECGEKLCRNCLEESKCSCLDESQPQPDEENDHDPVQSTPTPGGGADGEAAGGQTARTGGQEVPPARVEAA
ncbi:MAG: hypothetical protein NTV86_00385 [Planctomycetota bacterium]|nr:hypothetical protein [Planctomycetota bacterium]